MEKYEGVNKATSDARYVKDQDIRSIAPKKVDGNETKNYPAMKGWAKMKGDKGCDSVAGEGKSEISHSRTSSHKGSVRNY